METTLCMLFLESARRYSCLADAVFPDSVSRSQFASRVSGQRMEVAKTIHGGKLDIPVTLSRGKAVMEDTGTGWRECLDIDNIIMSVMAENNEFPSRQFTPLLQGVYEDALFCAEFIADRYVKSDFFRCLACGTVSNQAGGCLVCGSGGNWCAPFEITPPAQNDECESSWWIDC